MAITFYYGSGSPYAWRVHLALEHKALPYDRKILSFAAGDTRKPEFVALNPRHRVPTITDGDFTLYESNAIVEYLDEAYPGRGQPLFPGDAKSRALIRRLVPILPGLLRIRPSLTPVAAACLVVLMIGATMFTPPEQLEMALLPVIVGALAAFVAYGRWRLAPQRADRRAPRRQTQTLQPAG